jgi:hypothetical protein
MGPLNGDAAELSIRPANRPPMLLLSAPHFMTECEALYRAH